MRELIRLGLGDFKVIALSQGKAKSGILKRLTDEKIMVGDIENDYQSAIEAGCSFYILSRGFRSNKYWENKSIIPHEDLSNYFHYRQHKQKHLWKG